MKSGNDRTPRRGAEPHRRIAPRRFGFSLVELMVTLAIAAILVAAAAPAFTQTIRASRLSSQINEVVYALTMVRSEAVKRGTTVTLCKSSNGTSCGGTWNGGWIVFVDRNGNGIIEASDADINGNGTLDAGEDINGNGSLDSGDVLLKVAASTVRQGYSLSANNNFTNRVTYAPTGVSAVGTFVLCEGSDPARARAVAVNSAGRVRLAADSNGNGKPEVRNDCSGPPEIDITSCTPPFVPSC